MIWALRYSCPEKLSWQEAAITLAMRVFLVVAARVQSEEQLSAYLLKSYLEQGRIPEMILLVQLSAIRTLLMVSGIPRC